MTLERITGRNTFRQSRVHRVLHLRRLGRLLWQGSFHRTWDREGRYERAPGGRGKGIMWRQGGSERKRDEWTLQRFVLCELKGGAQGQLCTNFPGRCSFSALLENSHVTWDTAPTRCRPNGLFGIFSFGIVGRIRMCTSRWLFLQRHFLALPSVKHVTAPLLFCGAMPSELSDWADLCFFGVRWARTETPRPSLAVEGWQDLQVLV